MRTRAEGSITLELAVLAPALVLLLALVVVAVRVEVAAGAVEQAAAAGARAAALERSASAAHRAAAASARSNLAGQGVTCGGLDVAVDTAPFRSAVGRTGDVVVTVSCSIPFGDQGIPGLPGSRRVQARAASPLDAYRGR